LVIIKYFTKWIETKEVCCFRAFSEITVDNDKQFDNQEFKYGTKVNFASVYHPQSIKVVERTNRKIFTSVEYLKIKSSIIVFKDQSEVRNIKKNSSQKQGLNLI
jgi:hypothetical protein